MRQIIEDLNLPQKQKEDIDALFDAVQKYHKDSQPKGSIQTRAFCFCGNSSGGPVGTDACHGLHVLWDNMFI